MTKAKHGSHALSGVFTLLIRFRARHVLFTVGAIAVPHIASSQAPDSAKRNVEARLNDLDQRVRALTAQRDSATKSASRDIHDLAVKISDQDGLRVESADRAVQFRVEGVVQADSRFYSEDPHYPATSTLFLRRARPITEAAFGGKYTLRLMPDFGNGKAVLFDAYLEARLSHWLAVRAGKFKPPVGLEQLQTDVDIRFAERGFPSDLAPVRDIGWQLSGASGADAVVYQIGVFDGVPDLGNADGAGSNIKDVVGRVFLRPLRWVGSPSSVDVGIGAAVSGGGARGTLTAPQLATYLTPGQQTFLSYRGDGTTANTVIANGARRRASAQGYLYAGPVGLLSEYALSSQQVARAGSSDLLTHHAWQLAGSWFLTGERAAYGTVTPLKSFAPSTGGWGAIELTARYGALWADSRAFPEYVNPTTSPTAERAWAAGVNWHLERRVEFMIDYEKTTFAGGTATGNRAPEQFFVTRFQCGF